MATDWSSETRQHAAGVVALLDDRPPLLGAGHLVSIDGPAGAGKTTLAAALADRLAARGTPVRLVAMDDLFEGWRGLTSGSLAAQLDGLLTPLAAGRPGRYRRFDWHAEAFAETVELAPLGDGEVLVLEGVGSGTAAHVARRSVLVWVEAPHDLRMRRGIERDGRAFAAQWRAWAAQEEQHFRADRTRARADVVVDGGASAASPPAP